MTCEPTDPGHWSLTFPEPEAAFIINVLARLARHYQESVSQLPPALRAYWQGKITSGRSAGTEEVKESQETLSESRAELRSERLALAENWVREFELAEKRDPWKVEISTTERDEFVAMLNDRRMLLGHFILVTLGPQIHRP